MRHLFAVPAAAFAFAVPMLLSAPAQAADLSACSNIQIGGSAKCEVKVSGGCDVQCTPFNASLSCHAKLQGMCNATLPQCSIDCEAGCKGECNVNPGSFDCQAKCEAQVNVDCSGKCASSANKAQCDASCRATAKGECGAKCNVVPPSANCDVKCKAKCEGGCNGKARLDCQIQAQAGCVAMVEGGCKAQCKQPEGAVFCDGQFIETSSVQKCMSQLESLFKFHASLDASCSGNTCEASASVGCSAAPTAPTGMASWFGLGASVAGIALVAARRRRRQ
jgi:hypothetical protein